LIETNAPLSVIGVGCGRDARAPLFSAFSASPRENKWDAINRAPTP